MHQEQLKQHTWIRAASAALAGWLMPPVPRLSFPAEKPTLLVQGGVQEPLSPEEPESNGCQHGRHTEDTAAASGAKQAGRLTVSILQLSQALLSPLCLALSRLLGLSHLFTNDLQTLYLMCHRMTHTQGRACIEEPAHQQLEPLLRSWGPPFWQP